MAKKEKRKVSKWLWISGVSFATIALGIIVAGQFAMTSTLFGKGRFYEGTKVNGINVSGMTVDEVTNVVSANLVGTRDDVVISLNYNGKNWTWKGSDFEVNNEIKPVVENIFAYGRSGSFWERRAQVQQISKKGFAQNISYLHVLGGIDEKLEQVFAEIEKPAQEPTATFTPTKTTPFSYTEGQNGIAVDRQLLFDTIDTEFTKSKQINIEIPTTEIFPQTTIEQLKQNTVLRGSFSTSYENSPSARRFNVKKAFSYLNGKIVQSGEEVSFNQTTLPKNTDNGYQKANIILNGVYVLGTGGGVCQASTTLYNALLRSGIEILEANKHSLPVSYVPLSLDAMVSDGFSDMRFVNNTENPIYIKAWGDNSKCYVEIYGESLGEGTEYKTRVNFIRTIPHNGDTIITDTTGEYSDRVTFKGEYIRLKKPQEGYEAIAYLQKIVNGEIVEENEIRHEIYQPQQGVIIEGNEELGEGMTLPENDVKFIPPQKQTQTDNTNVEKAINNQNPEKYNP